MKNLIRLFKMAKPWYNYLAMSTFALFAVTGINLYAPYVTRSIISAMEVGSFRDDLRIILVPALSLLGLYVLRAGFQFVAGYFSHIGSWKLVVQIRCMLYDHFQHLSMGYYHDKQTGQLMSRVVNDASTFENLIAHAVPELATNFLTLAGVLIILLFINPTLTMLVSIPIPFVLFLSILMRRLRRQFTVAQEKIAEMNALLQDNFSGMKEIQAFNKQAHELERVSKVSAEHGTAIIKAVRISGIINPVVGLITNLGTVIVLIVGPILSLHTGLAIADVVAILLYLGLLYAPVTQLTRLAEDTQQALAGAERVFQILDTEPEIADLPNAQSVSRVSGEISFNDVSFSYENGIPVLEGIDFRVHPGQMVALVGSTGVGKTTLSSLISRFYEPTDGTITMDGIDIRDMTLESLRNQLSMVLQDVFLFNGTVAENIAYGCESATIDEIKAASEAACISEYIESLPEGYHTVIGERGVRLSGGQKQRLSIARAILRNSPILILDEATSSIDTETEREIQEAINRLAGTRTLIVIAHRLSTIRNADQIIVLEDCKIKEQGNHEELLALNGLYAGLCAIQSMSSKYDLIP